MSVGKGDGPKSDPYVWPCSAIWSASDVGSEKGGSSCLIYPPLVSRLDARLARSRGRCAARACDVCARPAGVGGAVVGGADEEVWVLDVARGR